MPWRSTPGPGSPVPAAAVGRPAPRLISRRALLAGAGAAVVSACAAPMPAPMLGTTVALLVASRQLSVSREMEDGFRSEVGHYPGLSTVVTGPEASDGPRAVQLFEELTRTSPAGISLFSLTPELFVGPVTAALAAGIPLIAVDSPPPHTTELSLFIGNDNYELGRLLARLVVAELNPKPVTGTIVLGTAAPGIPVLDRRADGIRDGLMTMLPGVNVLGPFDSKLEESANRAAWSVLVQANPEAVAFVGTGDADSYNLGELRREVGGTWVAGAFDLDPRALTAVQRGDLVVVSPEHYLKGAVAGRLQAARAVNGAALPTGWIYVSGVAVTGDNIESMLARQASVAARRDWFRPEIDDMIANLPAHTRPLDAIG